MYCLPNLKNTGLNSLVVVCQTKSTIVFNLNSLYLFNDEYWTNMSMPVFEKSLPSKNNTKPLKVKLAKPMKLLLVEDSNLLREVLCESINSLNNLSVEGMAATQAKAISLLNEIQFDILLLDIELLEGNGFEVIKHTKKLDYAFKAPIIMMLTNHANQHYRSLAKDLGVHYFFDKSMDFDLAMQAIELEAERFNKKPN